MGWERVGWVGSEWVGNEWVGNEWVRSDELERVWHCMLGMLGMKYALDS